MRKTSKGILAVAAGAFLLGASVASVAGERGKFQGHSVLVVTKFNEFKAPEGHPYKAAISGEVDGLLFHNGGGTKLDKMLDRAHYIVQFVGDAGTGTSYCMKTFTTSEGHKLFARPSPFLGCFRIRDLPRCLKYFEISHGLPNCGGKLFTPAA